jgi:hypothetical protein
MSFMPMFQFATCANLFSCDSQVHVNGSEELQHLSV